MSAPHNVCPKCGAPSAPFAPDVTTIACHFCGVPYPVRHPDADRVRREKEKAERALRDRESKEAKKKAKEEEKRESNVAGCLVPIVIFGLVAVIFGGSFWYEGYYKPRQWDGHHDFSCKSGEMTFTDLQATGDVDARGTCIINLIRPRFESHIKARDHAVINITSGRIHDSSGTVLSVEGFAKVVLKGTTVDGDDAVRAKGSSIVESQGAFILGKVRSDSAAKLVDFPPPPASASIAVKATPPDRAAPAPASPDRIACGGVTACFQPWDGKFSGKLTVTLDKSGTIKKTVITGSSTPAIKSCLTDIGTRNAAQAALQGMAPGDLSCTYSGVRNGFVTQVSSSGSFTRAP